MPRSDAKPSADREIVIIRDVEAPRELVWEAMTSPEHVVHWWGPRGFTTTIEEMDVRPGGVWKHVMHGPDGTDYPNKSVFKEVVKPERIVYAHGGGKKGAPGVNFVATWTFDALGDGKTRVTIHMVFPTAADRDRIVKEYGAIEGGKQTLERLSEQLVRTPVVMERVLDAPVSLVWEAITDIEKMREWYFPQLEAFKPEAGFQTEFNVRCGDEDYLHIWRVIEAIPERKIAYSWRYGGYPGDSVVTFELAAAGDKTRLTLTHAGLETFLPEVHPRLARSSFHAGWTELSASLQSFLVSKGQKMAQAEDQAKSARGAPRR